MKLAAAILTACAVGCSTEKPPDEPRKLTDKQIKILLERRALREMSAPPMPIGMTVYVPPPPPPPLPFSTNLSYNEFLKRERNAARRRSE